MLYKCFVKEMVPKYGNLADFSTTNLLIMHAHMFACIIVLWLKLEEKQLCNR